VLRFLSATFGDFLGYVQAGISLSNVDPWLWLCESGAAKLIGVHKQTFSWEGRIVLPAGSVWWAQSSSGDTCDMLASGYKLTNP